MITSLTIKDFILIDELEIVFDKGFNIITGETGAGKSIIINAIDLAFGARASRELIKSGKNKSVIEIVLKLSENYDNSIFEEQGIEIYENELIISREITEAGSRSRINGVLVAQDVMKKMREMFIDIHSQHMTYTYIQPKHHIHLLDSYGNEAHSKLVKSYKSLYSRYKDILNSLEAAKSRTELTEQQIEFLKFQITEIESAQILDVEEDEKLENELHVLTNSERLKELTYSSYWNLYGEDSSIVTVLGRIKSNISKASEYDNKLCSYEADLINCLENLKEISSGLRDYAEATELDEQRLNDVQLRIDTLDKIKRKYGNTLQKVLETYEGFLAELDSVDSSQNEIEKLEIEREQIFQQITESARELASSRISLAAGLSGLLTAELEKLDMPKVRFETSISPCELNISGADNVEFLISTNISESPKPLAKIASGGEISRVMLAIKTIFANTDDINTIIFDEIDTGISGKASQAVAEEIAELAKSHQIISITHQPIIAAKADRHFYVAKSQDEMTHVKVYTLDEENRIKAIAMLAAGDVTDDSINFAKQLIYS